MPAMTPRGLPDGSLASLPRLWRDLGCHRRTDGALLVEKAAEPRDKLRGNFKRQHYLRDLDGRVLCRYAAMHPMVDSQREIFVAANFGEAEKPVRKYRRWPSHYWQPVDWR